MFLPKIRDYLLITRYNNKVNIGSSVDRAVEIIDPSGAIFKIISEMNGTNTRQEILEKVRVNYKDVTGKDIDMLIDLLEKNKYIIEDHKNYIDYFEDYNKERHKRNINFLGNFSAIGSEKYEYIENIQNQRILLLGLGGVGSTILYNLSALGVKDILGVDYDIVDKTNLNRQILYRESDVGKLKVLSAKRTVKEFNSDIKFTTKNQQIKNEKELQELVSEYRPTFIICAADRPSILLNEWLNNVCLKEGLPWMYGGNSESVSYYRLVEPGITSCFKCSEINFHENKQFEAIEKNEYIRREQPSPQNNCIAASSSILGSMIVFDYIKYTTKMEKTKSNSSMIKFNYSSMNITENTIHKNDACKCFKYTK